MSLQSSINKLRSEQFSNEDILEDVLSLKPELSESVSKLRSEGFAVNDILDDIASLDLDEGPKPKEKVGKLKSALYGAVEGVLGLPALIQYGVSEISKPIESIFGEPSELTFEEENPLMAMLAEFPESEDAASRYIRMGTAGAAGGLPFGPVGALSGAAGGLAGQAVRETFGEEGKFEEFGPGEIAALSADVLAGGTTALAADLARSASRIRPQGIPQLFREPERKLQEANIRALLKGDKSRLESQISQVGGDQLRNFTETIEQIAPTRLEALEPIGVSGVRQATENLHRNGVLNTLSPFPVTKEQGGRVLQETAQNVFQENVINAERAAYGAASQEARELSGQGPGAVEMAKTLRDDLMRTTPTPEQDPTIRYLNGLIRDLEETRPQRVIPASTILDASGMPITPVRTLEAVAIPRTRSANDFIKMVQSGNQAINYDAQLREQSHRLKPIINKLREETRSILEQNKEALRLYDAANALHGTNAEIWGTKFMRDVRFTENPENLVSRLKLASNIRNFNEAIPSPQARGVAERLIVDSITSGKSSSASREALSNIRPELSPTANEAASNLIQVKDPLTTSGGRRAVQNAILQDVVDSISSGKRPEKILDMMSTPKGYRLARESLNANPQTRNVFSAIERTFIEDIFSSVLDKSGRIDFNKIKSIFKNQDTKEVVRMIGGDRLVTQFLSLENMARNFQRNSAMYSTPQAQSLFRRLINEGGSIAVIMSIMNMLHVPGSLIGAIGAGKAVLSTGIAAFRELMDKILTNPKAFRALEQISLSNTSDKLGQQILRLRGIMEGNGAQTSDQVQTP